MKSYGQFCGLAKALDAVGDRWSLLIVRELLLLGRARYTDLQRGLPGIASNMLAERLRHLEEAGVVQRTLEPPPIATTLFHLTARGEALVPALRELGRWGVPMLMESPATDTFHSYWMALPFDLYYTDSAPDRPPVTIELRTGDEPMTLETQDGRIRARRGTVESPDAVLAGPPKLVLGLLSRRIPLDDARRAGLTLTGDESALERVRPDPSPAAA